MYCAEITRPDQLPAAVPVPANGPVPRAGVLDERLTGEINLLRQELAELGISLKVAVIDDLVLWLTVRIRRPRRSPGSAQNMVYQIKERLSISHREVRVHFIPDRYELMATVV